MASRTRVAVRLHRAAGSFSLKSFAFRPLSTVQELCLHAEDAEQEGEHRAAQIEQELAQVDDPPCKVLIMAEYLCVTDGGPDRVKKIALEPGGVPQVRAAENQAEQHGKAQDARNRLVAGNGARKHADRDEEEARDRKSV